MADKFHRLIRLLQAVPRQPRAIDTEALEKILISEGLRTTRRTIQRDLLALERLPFGLECIDKNKPYRWRYKETASTLLMPGADPQAALALRLVELYLERMMPRTALRALQPHLDASKKALDGKPVARWLDKVRLIPRYQPLIPPKVDGHIVGVIHEALLEGRQIEATYRAGGAHAKPKELLLHPLGLVYRDELAYLVATAWNYDDVRIYPFQRFLGAKLLEAPARARPGFNIEKFTDDGELAWRIGADDIHVALLFEPGAGRALEESPLSAHQILTRRADHKLVVEATVPDTHVFRAWLLSFGAGVEVLRPAPLRKAIAEATAAAAAKYRAIRR